MQFWSCDYQDYVQCGGGTHCVVSFRARRAAKEAKDAPAQPAPEKVKVEVKKFVKIGRPGYKGKTLSLTHALYLLNEISVCFLLLHR